MTESAWLARAVSFRIDATEDTLIEQRRQRTGPPLWAVTQGHFVLNRSGEWEYEPQPSSRTDKFLQQTRFESKEAAFEAWKTRKGNG